MSMVGDDAISRDAERWLESGLLDVEFYSALRGRDLTDPVAAAHDFVHHGMRRRLSPHPFLDFVSLPRGTRRAWRQGDVPGVLARLTDSEGRARPVGPLSDPADPVSARADVLALARRLGRESARAEPDPPRVDWAAVARQVRQTGRTSVVVPTTEASTTLRAVAQLLQHADDRDVEVLVVDCGSKPHVALALHAALHERAGVRLLRVPATVSAASGTNVGVAHATGATVVLLRPHVLVRRGWLDAVLAPLDDPEVAGVQPLVLRPDDTIDAAGVLLDVEGRRHTPLLRAHPKEDARRLRGHRLTAISPEGLVIRTEEFVTAGGLDPWPTWEEVVFDLCGRLLPRRPAGFRLAPDALVTSLRPDEPDAGPPPYPTPVDPALEERLGFATGSGPLGSVVSDPLPQSRDRLRWSIKLPSPAGWRGDVWGDTHFAEALARALRDLGQDVVTRRRGAHTAGPTHLDDVSLALRGLHPIPPTPGQRNVLWVISHPDDVDPREFDGYDLVCAASVPWSAALSARTGREVVPLLQATEFRRPTTAASDTGREPVLVFVGSAIAGRERPLVRKAAEAGVELAVYGRGWQDLPPGVWQGEYVDNALLPELYRRHGIVLADHWPDMARHGFIANRVFDAVASGARVICDEVVGVHDVFDPRDVVVVRSPQEIATALIELDRTPPDEAVPRPEMTFHDRARTLLSRVSRV